MPKDSNENGPIKLRRILVAIDTSAHSSAALKAAAVLAKQIEGQIQGLFVQDEIWDKISRIPSTMSVNELTGNANSFGQQDLQHKIDLLKNRLQRQLKTISRENNISHTWETVQGRVEDKILQAAKDADLITIGRRGSSFPQKKKLGSSAKTIIQTADKPILILKKGLQLGKSVAAIYDKSEQSHRSIRLALWLAEKNESETTIFRIDSRSDNLQMQDEKLNNMIKKSPVSVGVQQLQMTDIRSLIHYINKRRAGLLIIPKDQPLFSKSLETVLYQLNCPLLMMS